MRGRNLAGALAIFRKQETAHVAGRKPACTGVDHRADDGPHHLVAERVRPDLEPQQAGAIVGGHLRPACQHHIALHRRVGLTGHRPRLAAERREVVFADERIAGQAQGRQRQRLEDMPRGRRQKCVWLRRVPDVVSVVPPLGAESGTEVLGFGPVRITNDDGWTTHPVDTSQKRLYVDLLGKIAADHLPPAMNAGIGAPGTDESHRLLEDLLHRFSKLAHHGAHSIVLGKPVERRALVRNGQSGPLQHGINDSFAAVAQNIYDDEEFFVAYSGLRRSVEGLDGAPEWPTLRSMLPDMTGRRVVDLGCGFGWFARWAVSAGAASVLGIDLSEKMLERATTDTSDDRIAYQRQDLESVDLPKAAFDVAYSSLALHYLPDLGRIFASVHQSLVPGGAFVFSIEHPMCTAPSNPEFVTDASGGVAWPVDQYLIEGPRTTDWLAPGIQKYHRTITSYVSGLHEAGFVLSDLCEWGPSAAQIAEVPEWAIELERPQFLLVGCHGTE